MKSIIRRVLNENNEDRYLDKIVSYMIEDTEYGFIKTNDGIYITYPFNDTTQYYRLDSVLRILEIGNPDDWFFSRYLSKEYGIATEQLLDAQEKGEIPHDILFLWDSVGSVPCKMTYEGKGGKQHNAAVLADKIGMGINQRISGSRKSDSKHENTLIIINQPWVELPDNPFGQPKIKAKGGEAIWLNSSLVFLFGNQKGAGTNKISATKDKRTVKFAIRTKVSVLKNHINGLGYEDGKIIVTPHGFLAGKDAAEEKASIEAYKKENAEYWSQIIGVDGDFDLKEEVEPA